jgi:hypothetical protein
MKIATFSKILSASVLAGLFAAGTASVSAEAKIDVKDPKFDALLSPVVGGNTNEKKFSPKDWLEVEVEFTVEAVRPETKDGYIDQAEIRWFVAVENPGGKGFWLLEKQVTHVNIEVGESTYASVYLSPSSVKRLSGSDRANKGLVWGVGGEISVAGTTVQFNSKGSKPWWTSGNLSRTDKVPLLNKNETPFKGLWWDRYAEIQERR